MKLNEMLSLMIERKEKQKAETLTDVRQFERNCRATYSLTYLSALQANLAKYTCFIGQKVYKYKNTFNYCLVDGAIENGLNKLDKTEIEFTEQLFNQFVFDYLSFLIDRLTNELLESQVYFRSTSKLDNLIQEWQLEEKQELIKSFKELLKQEPL
jgi:hypothetical protein